MTHSMIRKSIVLTVLYLLTGCVPVPSIKHEEQKITSLHTSEYKNIESTRERLNNTNMKTIYIYIDRDGAVNDSGAGIGELPPRMRRQLFSILSDFGHNIKVITSGKKYMSMRKKYAGKAIFYALDGAITLYDKDVMSQSSGINFGFDFGDGEGEGNADSKIKDKDGLSILGVDFYLRQNEIITNTVKSKIDVKSTTRGYSFGLSINQGGFGVSASKTLKDGIGLSVRKLLEKSMAELINQITN